VAAAAAANQNAKNPILRQLTKNANRQANDGDPISIATK
jgi:hypothetical protein